MSLPIGNFTVFGTTRALLGSKSHFLICKSKGPSNEDGFISIFLEYAQIVWGKVEQTSLKKLIYQTKDYLEKMQKTPAGRKLILDLIGRTDMEAYWGICRQLSRLYGDPEESLKIK